MDNRERKSGILRALKDALLPARGRRKTAADESDTAEKAGAGAEKQAQENASESKGESVMNEETKRENPAEGEAGEMPERDETAEKVRAFIAAYPAAVRLKEEILEQLRADKDIQSDPYCLEIALGRAAGKAFKTAQEYIRDEDFIREYVLADENIKGRIIQEYLSGVAGGMPPAVMASSGKMAALPPSKPTSVSAAGQILERMLKERRI